MTWVHFGLLLPVYDGGAPLRTNNAISHSSIRGAASIRQCSEIDRRVGALILDVNHGSPYS